MGVTNVGSITNPSVAPTESAALPATPAPAPEAAPAAPVQNDEADPSANIRRELESIFGDIAPATETADTTTAVVENVTAPEPVTTALPPAVEVPAAPVAVAQTEQPKAENSDSMDPLSELPDGLRNQLNDLVSSLEADSPKAVQEVPEAVEQPVAAPTAIPAAPVSVDVPSAEITLPEPQQVEPEVVEEAKPPVRDESISSMFEEAMRAIQSESAANKAASENVESINPVQGSTAPSAPEPTPEAPVAPEPAVVETPEPAPAPKAQSVADILGAMGMVVPGQDEMAGDSSQAAAPTYIPEPTPEPVQEPEPTPATTQSVPTAPVFSSPQNEPSSDQAETAPASGGAAEDDIQAYMNRLLNREPVEEKTEAEKEEEIAREAAAKAAAEAEAVKPLSREEFIPSHKPSRPENYDTLREIANTCSRTAVSQSNRRSRKESVVMKIGSGVVAMVLAVGAFLVGQTLIAGIFVAVSAVCLVLGFMSNDSTSKKKAVVKTTKAREIE